MNFHSIISINIFNFREAFRKVVKLFQKNIVSPDFIVIGQILNFRPVDIARRAKRSDNQR